MSEVDQEREDRDPRVDLPLQREADEEEIKLVQRETQEPNETQNE